MQKRIKQKKATPLYVKAYN